MQGGEWGPEAHSIPPIKTRGHASDQSPGQMELSQNTVGRSTPPPPLLSLRLTLGSQPVGAGIRRKRQDVGLQLPAKGSPLEPGGGRGGAACPRALSSAFFQRRGPRLTRLLQPGCSSTHYSPPPRGSSRLLVNNQENPGQGSGQHTPMRLGEKQTQIFSPNKPGRALLGVIVPKGIWGNAVSAFALCLAEAPTAASTGRCHNQARGRCPQWGLVPRSAQSKGSLKAATLATTPKLVAAHGRHSCDSRPAACAPGGSLCSVCWQGRKFSSSRGQRPVPGHSVHACWGRGGSKGLEDQTVVFPC